MTYSCDCSIHTQKKEDFTHNSISHVLLMWLRNIHGTDGLSVTRRFLKLMHQNKIITEQKTKQMQFKAAKCELNTRKC